MINKNKKSGFTLIETLIAVLVLMVAITGPLTIASKGLQVTLIAKDQDTAFYLAQDAMEYVRWVRDTNNLKSSNSDWLAGLDGTPNGFTQVDGVAGDCVSSTGTASCTVNSLQPNAQYAIASCNGASSCLPINYDSTNDYYTYASTGGTVAATIFTRTVQIITPVGSNAGEAIASTSVSWMDPGGVLRDIQVREDLFNWH